MLTSYISPPLVNVKVAIPLLRYAPAVAASFFQELAEADEPVVLVLALTAAVTKTADASAPNSKLPLVSDIRGPCQTRRPSRGDLDFRGICSGRSRGRPQGHLDKALSLSPKGLGTSGGIGPRVQNATSEAVSQGRALPAAPRRRLANG
jgi:hypothetical protein